MDSLVLLLAALSVSHHCRIWPLRTDSSSQATGIAVSTLPQRLKFRTPPQLSGGVAIGDRDRQTNRIAFCYQSMPVFRF
jgi:hypothetical protein